MTRSSRTPYGAEGWHTRGSWRSAWRDAGGLLPILAAVALWAWLITQVLSPLGAALARLETTSAPDAAAIDCPVPPGAIAAAAPTTATGECP